MDLTVKDVFSKLNSHERLDAYEGPMFERDLTYVSSVVLEEQLKPLNYTKCATVTSELPAGATTMEWYETNGYGMARWHSNYSNQIPRVDIGATRKYITVKRMVLGYHYTMFEIRSAIYAGIPLESRRVKLVREGIERKINSTFFNGDTAVGIPGFIKFPGIPEATIPATGTGTTKTWSTKTAENILEDLALIRDTVYETTVGYESINTIAIPYSQLSLIKRKIIGDDASMTVYKFFTENNPGINIIELPELKDAGTGSTDMIMGWVNSPDHIRVEVPEPFASMPPERDGFNYTVDAYASYAGIILYRPLSAVWGEGI